MNETTGPQTDFTNVLSNDVSIVGSLKFTNDLVFDGHIDGEVISDGNLTVGDMAKIKGEVRSKSAVIYGNIEGNIYIEKECTLKATSQIQGDVSAGALSIEAGARFSGRSMIGSPPKK